MSSAFLSSHLVTSDETASRMVSRPLPGGELTRTARVSLATAYLYMQAGWMVVGPDPEDEAAFATWQRDHAFVNRPRCLRP